jgi:hypothetical protein
MNIDKEDSKDKQMQLTGASFRRYDELKKFLNDHSIDKADKTAFDEALAWSDKASKQKQAKDNAQRFDL